MVNDISLPSYFLSKGWIVPSLSPWAALVSFVSKKFDLITSEKTWRMVISYVRLNSETLNRITYRLPPIQACCHVSVMLPSFS
jgi:hypothetical protein